MPISAPGHHSGSSLTRRQFAAASGTAIASSGWLPSLAAAHTNNPQRQRSCILLWMFGGPSQIDTFAPLPDHRNGGGVNSIATSVPGIHISENLPQVAEWMDHLAVVRSMSTAEGDHTRGSYLMRTGYRSQGPVQYPSMGSLYSQQLANAACELPGFVSVGGIGGLNQAAWGPGFLGPEYAPLMVRGTQASPDDAALATFQVENLALPNGVSNSRQQRRLQMLTTLEQRFAGDHPGRGVSGHQSAYADAVTMMHSEARTAFDLQQEPAALRERYGSSEFGQGCLLARRLVERGVPFVEVALTRVPGQNNISGWDTHQENKDRVASLCGVLDPAWATLMDDLKTRGLLETTTVVWMGEFGRTPAINGNAGRDHFPAAWSAVIGGGGVHGGQVIGQTSKDGMRVTDRPVSSPDFLATVCGCLGIDGTNENLSNIGRPIPVVDSKATAIEEIVA